MLKFFIMLLFSLSIFANSQNILKNLNKKIIQNNKTNKTSFVIFNLDNTLFNNSERFKFLFNNYLKKHHLRAIKDYVKNRNFNNLQLNDILFDLNNLKLNNKQKDNLKNYLTENYQLANTLSLDTAIENSVNFVSSLHKNGAFIIYITNRNLKLLTPTINSLNKLNFPIGVNRTTLIMNVNIKSIRTILSKWINQGEIISIFNSNIKEIKTLLPYFNSKNLFLISKDNLNTKDFEIIKGL